MTQTSTTQTPALTAAEIRIVKLMQQRDAQVELARNPDLAPGFRARAERLALQPSERINRLWA